MLGKFGYRRCLGVLAWSVAIISNSTFAAPSSDDIIKMCERALGNGFRGRPAQMCTWYVTPCDCDIGRNSALRVCVPEETATRVIAEQVVTLLNGLPEFRQKDGEKAVRQVLAVRYPCSDELEPNKD